MKYLEDSRLTTLTTELMGAILNTRDADETGRNTSWHSQFMKSNAAKGSKGKRQKHLSSGDGTRSTSAKNKRTGASSKSISTANSSNSTMASYCAYNPVGYSSYNSSNHDGGGGGGGGGRISTSNSCRVMYGRVEAYTTKRAGSDKKTAFEVGERYAHEMERLNEAVESLKRRHALEQQQRERDVAIRSELVDENGSCEINYGDTRGGKDEKKNFAQNLCLERKIRSCSMDGVTFFNTISNGKMSRNAIANDPLTSLDELSVIKQDNDNIALQGKRNIPTGGSILKPPSNSKRCRATSFDVSTGPSTIVGLPAPRRYNRSDSSSSLLAGTTWGSSSARGDLLSRYPATASSSSCAVDEDQFIHPLIPQPSLYQSFSDHNLHADKAVGGGPTMVPRRLVTDLILTLNASFPDYDFRDAQVSDFCTLSTSEAMRRINEKLGEFAATTNEGRGFIPRFWSALDDVLFRGLKDCEVYSYSPSSSGGDDPLEFLTMSLANEHTTTTATPSSGLAVVDGNASSIGDATVMFSPSGGGRIVSRDNSAAMALDFSGNDSPPHVTLWSMNYFFVSRNKKRIVLFACVQTMRTPQGNDDNDDLDGDYDEYGENDLVFDEIRRDGMLRMRREADREEEFNSSDGYPSNVPSFASGSRGSRTGFSSPTGDESVSVMVEDTDFEDGSVDVDGDVDRGDDFDTGTLGVSINVPSQVA